MSFFSRPRSKLRRRCDGASGHRARTCRIYLFVLAVACAVAAAQATAHAEERESYAATVAADHVHVRSGPGTEYYPTDILRRGDRVQVCGLDGDGWCRVRPPDGSFSYIAAEDITDKQDGTARIKHEKVKINVGSRFTSQRDAVQVMLDEGELVTFAENQKRQDTADTQWRRIKPPVGEFRWIHKQFLRREVPEADDEPLIGRVRQASYEEDLPEPRLLGEVQAQPLDRIDEARGGASAGALLEALELELAAISTGRARVKNMTALQADAQEALRRAQSASDRNRAEIVVRRVERLAGAANPQDALSATLPGFASLAQYMAPMVGPPVVGGPAPVNCGPMGGAGMGAPGMAGPPPMYPYALPGTRHYLSLDALGWWVKHDTVPALVTTSPIGTPQDAAGVLGQPGTSVLFGNQNVNGGVRPGGRVMGGIWLDDQQTFALEGHYYALATAATNYSASSVFSNGATGDPILARPFFNNSPLVNAQDALLVAYPNYDFGGGLVLPINGSVEINESSNIQSAGAGGRWSWAQYTSPGRMFLVGGYRFFQLSESLSIVSRSSFLTPPFATRPNVTVFDYFGTTNTFNGGDIGLGGEYRFRNRFWFGGETRLAMGNMKQTLNINGVVAAQDAGFVASLPNGLLAQPSNMGSFTNNYFALIPSVDLKLGYQVAPPFRVTIGYNFTYVTTVLRPGAQVDTTVNTTQIAGQPLVGPASPVPLFNRSGIWLQGVTAGMEFDF